MNPTPQFDPHPEAEMLSAFAEHALPEPERLQLLAHLADCGRCRQVLFLAQEAAEAADPAVQPVFAPERTPLPRMWIANWRLAWVAVPVCAAIVTIAFVLQVRRPQSPPQVAKATPTAVVATPQPASNEARPTAPSPRIVPPQIQPTPATESKPAAKAAASKSPAKPTHRVEQAADSELPRSQEPSPQLTPAASRQPASAPTPAMAQMSVTTPTPSPQPPPPAVAANSFAGGAGPAPRPQPAAPARPAASGGARSFAKGVSGLHGFVSPARPGAPSPGLPSAVSGRTRPLSQAAADSEAARRTLYSKLPNGLIAISTAAAQHRLLAIDSSGALLLSEDYGVTWQPVAQQWTGRALQVRANQAPIATTPAVSVPPAPATVSEASAKTASASSSAAGQAPPANPVPVFEILTDAVSTWTSTDGKTWQPKPSNPE